MVVSLTRNADGDTTEVVVVEDGVETHRWTLEEAHQWLSDNMNTDCTDACAKGECKWCLVMEATEGIR